jgi:hypothetical protein
MRIIDKALWKPGLFHIHSDTITKYDMLVEFNKKRNDRLVIEPVNIVPKCDRTLTTLYPDFLAGLCIPPIKKQIESM